VYLINNFYLIDIKFSLNILNILFNFQFLVFNEFSVNFQQYFNFKIINTLLNLP